MNRPRARILPRAEISPESVRALPRPSPSVNAPRSVRRAVLDAEEQGRAIVAEAKRQAEQIQLRAQQAADDIRLQAEARARAEALALVVSQAVQFGKRETQRARSSLDQAVDLATLLAERLLGEELSLAPGRVAALAQQALREAAGARRATIVANPDDAAQLRATLNAVSTELEDVQIKEEAGLAQGHLRVETELGVIEAELKGQLRRLATQLRKLLHTHGSTG
jgi:flagellar biosynthesis/type III secretory pathway protein FliH